MAFEEANKLLGGARAAVFAEIGDSITLKLTGGQPAEVTDPATGAVKKRDDGKPVMQIIYTGIDENGEERRLFAKGQMKVAIREACNKVSAEPYFDGRLTIKLVERKPNTNKALKPQNIFEASYVPPQKQMASLGEYA